MGQLKKPFETDDLEREYSPLVMKMAYLLSKKTPTEFRLISYRSRNNWIGKARRMALSLINDKEVGETLIQLAPDIERRIK